MTMTADGAVAGRGGSRRPTIAVAALSARAATEAAVRDGYDVVALDLFGDADTRAAAVAWQPIGRPDALRLDTEATLAALRRLASDGRVDGWVPGSGFEAEPELLERGAALLPLLGTAPADVRAVRDPVRFFDWLAAAGADHPPVAFDSAPPEPDGWLAKDAAGSGGWHIRRAGTTSAADDDRAAAGARGRYFQREAPGRSMSATFVANGVDAVVLGFNELTVRAVGGRPFVFCGAIGPVGLEAGAAAGVVALVRRLAVAFRLRGLGSLDFLLDGDVVRVLEVDPRLPATLALYAGRAPMAAHLRACLHGELPIDGDLAAAPSEVSGFEIVFAQRPIRLDAGRLGRLAAWPDVHDVPAAAGRLAAADPVCSLGADGVDAAEVRGRLASNRDALLRRLET